MTDPLKIMDEIEQLDDIDYNDPTQCVLVAGPHWKDLRDDVEKAIAILTAERDRAVHACTELSSRLVEKQKRGQPKGSVQQHSLTAKLASMAVGDILVFPDSTCPAGSQTSMTSALTTYPKRMAILRGRKFSGKRATVVGVDMQTFKAMIVTREENE